jgi:hypothetical protein
MEEEKMKLYIFIIKNYAAISEVVPAINSMQSPNQMG